MNYPEMSDIDKFTNYCKQLNNIQTQPTSPVDPYNLLLKRKKQGEDTTLPPSIEYDPNDIWELEEFCKQHNIIGFNFGRMNPKAALQMLKSRIGMKETPKPTKSSLLCG